VGVFFFSDKTLESFYAIILFVTMIMSIICYHFFIPNLTRAVDAMMKPELAQLKVTESWVYERYELYHWQAYN